MSIRAKLIYLLLKVTHRGDALFGTAKSVQEMMDKNAITNEQPLTIKSKSKISQKTVVLSLQFIFGCINMLLDRI